MQALLDDLYKKKGRFPQTLIMLKFSQTHCLTSFMRLKMAELHKLKDYATVYTLKVLLLVPFSTRPQEFTQLGYFFAGIISLAMFSMGSV